MLSDLVPSPPHSSLPPSYGKNFHVHDSGTCVFAITTFGSCTGRRQLGAQHSTAGLPLVSFPLPSSHPACNDVIERERSIYIRALCHLIQSALYHGNPVCGLECSYSMTRTYLRANSGPASDVPPSSLTIDTVKAGRACRQTSIRVVDFERPISRGVVSLFHSSPFVIRLMQITDHWLSIQFGAANWINNQ